MQKPALLIIFFLLYSELVFSQIVLKRTINWKAPKEIILPYEQNELPEKRVILHFENATYQSTDSPVPVFFELIRVDSDYQNFRVSLSNELYADLLPEELAALGNWFIPENEIILETKLFFQRKVPYINFQLIPIRKNPFTNKSEKLVSFEINIIQDFTKNQSISSPKNTFASTSVLSTGKWVKIRVENDGIHQLTFSELQAMGFANPNALRLFGNGNKMLPLNNNEPRIDDLVEKDIFIERGTDGVFNRGDFILFYAQGPISWNYNSTMQLFEHSQHLYSNYNYYFLTSLPGIQKIIADSPTPTGNITHIAETFDDYAFHEKELNNLILSGKRWFGELFDVETIISIPFSFPNIVTGTPLKIISAFAARSPVASTFSIHLNQEVVMTLNIAPVTMGSQISAYANIVKAIGTISATSNNFNLTVNYNKPAPSSQGWLDYILVNARRNLTMTGSQMHFRDIQSTGTGNITEFKISGAQPGIKVWDVTDFSNVQNITGTLEGNVFRFRQSTNNLKQFIAFTNNNFLKPHIVGNVVNQNLHGMAQPDFIIISHPLFLSQANQLAEHRRSKDGMNVIVVTPEEIYNEFSGGKPDVAALRNFVKMFYDRAISEADMPKYLLLFGDGSINNLDISPSNTNFIITYQSDNSTHPTLSFVTDDFFGLLDNNEGDHTGLLDIGIGRIPAKTPSEAQSVINKIIRYEEDENRGDWQNYLCFIGDDGDNNIHMHQADILAEYVKYNYPFFNIEKIYLDAYQRVSGSGGQSYPEVNRAIQNRINRGVLLVNYTGHGNELRLAHENIFDIRDILSLKNKNFLPVFMTATCEFSRFDNPQRTSAGETLLLFANGGGIALFSTTRLVYATPNFFLNQNFSQFIFRETNGELYRLGEVMRLTKNNSGTGINKLNFTLLGDPSLQLAIPKFNIKITEINGVPVAATPDTLKAMGKYTIKGEIEMNGNKVNNFNGLIYSTVFDKIQPVTTLSNDGPPHLALKQEIALFTEENLQLKMENFHFPFLFQKTYGIT